MSFPLDIIDITKPEKEIVLNKISEQNGYFLIPDEFELTSVAENDNPAYNTNTVVTLEASNRGSSYNSKKLYYDRVSMADIFNDTPNEIFVEGATKLSELIDQINRVYGIYLRDSSYEEQDLPVYDPENPNASFTVQIKALPESLLFCGEGTLVVGPKEKYISSDNVERSYYVVFHNVSNLEFKQSIKKLKDNSKIDGKFNFAYNASDITAFVIDNVLMLPNETLAVFGDFKFTRKDFVTSNSLLYNGKTLLVNADGYILPKPPVDFFKRSEHSPVLTNKTQKHYYTSNATDGVIRYIDAEGAQDTTYAPAIEYTPAITRVCPDGKLLTVSELKIGELPWDDAVGHVNHVRIDRLLVTGEIDPDFEPVVYTGQYVPTGQLRDPLQISDICVLDDNSFWVCFVPVDGVGEDSTSVIIDGYPITPGNTGYKYAWSPVVRFLSNGKLNRTSSSIYPNYLGDAIYAKNGTALQYKGSSLVGYPQMYGVILDRENPITKHQSPQLVTFGPTGGQYLLKGAEYDNGLMWTQVSGVKQCSSGDIVVYGKGSLIKHGGGWGVPKNMTCRYNAYGVLEKVLLQNQPFLEVSDMAWISDLHISEIPLKVI